MVDLEDVRRGSLLVGERAAWAAGDVEWSEINGSWRMKLTVEAEGFDSGELELVMVVRPSRPAEPTLQLMHGLHHACRRLDVNQVHAEPGQRPRRETHIQGSPPPDFVQWLGGLGYPFPSSEADTVSGEEYKRVFDTFCKLTTIDVSAVDWVDPPERR